MQSAEKSLPPSGVKSLQTTMRLLTLSFLLAYFSLGVAIFSGAEESGQTYLAVALMFFLIFYGFLGVQASRLNKSVVTWVGIALLTSPFGPLIFYVWARNDTKAALRLMGYSKEVVNRIAEEGDLAFQSNVPRTGNPYRSPNTADQNLALASFWDRGYSVAEKRQRSNA